MPTRHARAVLTTITAVTFAVTTGGAVAASRTTGTTSDRVTRDTVTATSRLAGDVVPHLAAARDLGATSGSRAMTVDLTLARPNNAGELALYHAMYTPGSPSYHQFLTPAQFNARFGVATHTYDAVKSWATRDGLRVLGEQGSGDILRLSGTATEVGRTFSVSLHNYTANGRHFYANTSAPRVPAAHAVEGVVGLTDLYASHTYSTAAGSHSHGAAADSAHGATADSAHGATADSAHGATADSAHGATAAGTTATRHAASQPAQSMCGTAAGCMGLTTPRDLWSTYDMPGPTANPKGNLTVNFGQGQQMAVFGEGRTAPVLANLRSFESLNKLPRVPVTVVRTDGKKAKYTDNAGEVEWDLDTQSSTGMSPDVRREVLYFGKDLTDASVLGVFNAWANDPDGPLQANASYGECEENPAGDAATGTAAAYSAGAMYTLKSEDILRKATMEGRTLFSSTGDTGGTCPVLPVSVNGVGYETPGVNYPAVSPYVVGVGGTVLYTNGAKKAKRSTEYGWTYGGGGTSNDFLKPSYQNGISAIAGTCSYTPGGGTANLGKPCRGIPDIAAQSGDVATNGYAIVAEGETAYPGGGTSLSSPLSMGMWTRVQAAKPGVIRCGAKTASYRGLGFANPTLYKAFKAKHGKRDFFDIGGGAPKSPPSDAVPYPSTAGWDYQSGMGVMDIRHLILDAVHRHHSTRPAHAVLPKQPKGGTGKRPNACTPLFTDPSGDDTFVGDPDGGGSNPQLDILAGNIDYVRGSTPMLRTVMVIRKLSTTAASAAGGGNNYYFLWTYKGTQYFSDAEVDSTGAVTYHAGHVDGNTYSADHDGLKGKFVTGKDGRVIVDVPLSDVGKPKKGATLAAPTAATKVVVGALLEAADSADAHYDYVVGQKCHSSRGIAAGPYRAGSTGAVLHYKRSYHLRPVAKHGHSLVHHAKCPAKTAG